MNISPPLIRDSKSYEDSHSENLILQLQSFYWLNTSWNARSFKLVHSSVTPIFDLINGW